MAKILSLIGAHICTAPRPQKEADLFAELGHEVLVRGVWFDPALIERDKQLRETKSWDFQPVLCFERRHLFRNRVTRVKRKIALEVFQKFNIFSPELLGYGAREMLSTVQREKPDLTIIHSEAGLWVGSQLLQQGFRVGIDFEDWFSEDLPLEARKGRPTQEIRQFEETLARSCQYSLTTSTAMAENMTQSFGSPPPTVIYNTFPWADRKTLDGKILDRKDLSLPSLHWFSHTIGKGRGLEQLLEALLLLKTPVEIHLRGNYPESTRLWLESSLPSEWKRKFFIHPLVSNDDLLSRIAEHDIGLALESSEVRSRDLTITNKLFQYMLGGLAIVATDTAGQREALSSWLPQGQLIPVADPLALANAIDALLESKEKLINAKEASLRAAEHHYCWEKEIPKLKRALENALPTPSKKPLKHARSSNSESLVSILIPCYNAEKWISQTIESALQQSWKNIEIIIVDDGSDDDTLQKAIPYEEFGVKVISQSNHGASHARNVALEHSSGKFIQYLDADDVLGIDKIKAQMGILERETNHQYIASSSWGPFQNEIGSTPSVQQAVNRDLLPIDWLVCSWEDGGMMPPVAWLIPRKVAESAGPWNEELSLNDDGEFFTRVLLASDGTKHCPEAQCYYRTGHSGRLSASSTPKAW
ncbi:MAG: glycosyltransferase, partial [Bdellovibrionales bacterium]|nr:glycosyltransferase [Bdellovibrionales bacterium]